MQGTGPAKRAELAAVVEIARRALAQRLAEAPLFDSPQAVRDYLRLRLAHLQHEVFAVLFLDSQHRLLGDGRDVSRHAYADERLSARSRQARAASSARQRSCSRTTIRPAWPSRRVPTSS